MKERLERFLKQSKQPSRDVIQECRRLTHEEGDPASASALLKAHIEAKGMRANGKLHSHFSNYLYASGDLASAIRHSEIAVRMATTPTLKDVTLAMPHHCLATVCDEHRLLFVKMPKCGSSTISNYFTTVLYGAHYGEHVHRKHPDLTRLVAFEEFSTRYRDYFKFTVVRDSIDRFFSYITRNVSLGCLKRDALGQTTSNGLPTRPGPQQVIRHFHDYRRIFPDFRQHTDRTVDFIGSNPMIFDRVFSMRDIGEIREIIATRTGKPIEDKSAMVSAKTKSPREDYTSILRKLDEFYAADRTLLENLK